MTIVDYCSAMQRKEIVVNREYQRNDKVWPPAARSYLVETVLLDFPMPKLSLHQKTDVQARRVIKEIVDGQQRSSTLRDFYEDKFALSKSIETEEWQGLRFSDLGDELQQRYIDYQLSIDLFTGASDSQVREVFRRMNSYTVPLNAEEQRHASWQGMFKWFVHSLVRQYDQGFLSTGIFNERALVRMQDTKLITEICRAMTFGIETTKKPQLDQMYRQYDEEFPQQAEYESRLKHALEQVTAWEEIHNTYLMKPQIAYALILAIIHIRKSVAMLEPIYPSPNKTIDRGRAAPRMTSLADALTVDENDRDKLTASVKRFVVASTGGGANLKEKRKERFRSFCEALDA